MSKGTRNAAGLQGNGAAQKAPGAGDFATVTVSEEVLKETPARVLKFISAVNRSKPIRAALESRGLSPAVMQQGWGLLHASAGMKPEHGDTEDLDPAVRDATTALDDAEEDLLATVRASLAHTFPAQSDFVLANVKSVHGPECVFVVETVLDRLDTLEKGKGRQKTRGADKAALERLAQRGYSAQRRAALRALVNTARGVGRAAASAGAFEAAQSESRAERESHLASLRALRAWFEEWSGIAHLAVRRRDYLLRLGLAQRHATAADGPAAAAGAAAAAVK